MISPKVEDARRSASQALISYDREQYVSRVGFWVIHLQVMALAFLGSLDTTFTSIGIAKYGAWIEGNSLWHYIASSFGLHVYIILASIRLISISCILVVCIDVLERNYFNCQLKHQKFAQIIRLCIILILCVFFTLALIDHSTTVWRWILLLF